MSKKEQLLGKIRLGYDDLIMPLEVAHKLQTLLAEHATKLDTVWSNTAKNSLYVLHSYETGAVEIFKASIDFDARGIDYPDYVAWQTAIRDRAEGDVVMSPQDFVALRGDNNE